MVNSWSGSLAWLQASVGRCSSRDLSNRQLASAVLLMPNNRTEPTTTAWLHTIKLFRASLQLHSIFLSFIARRGSVWIGDVPRRKIPYYTAIITITRKINFLFGSCSSEIDVLCSVLVFYYILLLISMKIILKSTARIKAKSRCTRFLC